MNNSESKKRISQNIIINLFGNVAPAIVAIPAIPYVIERIGKERFGLLSIAWLFLGYFSILDLGIGRATTKFVVDYYHDGQFKKLKTLIWTSTSFLIIVGLFVGLLLFLFTPIITSSFFKISENLRSEAIQSFYFIAVSVPFVTGAASLRGVLEAQHKFKLLNIIKIPSGLLNYLIPAAVSFYTNNLAVTILLMTLSRILLAFVYGYYCFKPFSHDEKYSLFDYHLIKQLFSYGGWLTISNIISPVMTYFDRFIIGSMLTLTLLTYYTTPYEIITKILIIAGSAATVLFPVFTKLHKSDFSKLNEIYNQSVKVLFVALFPLTLFLSLFSNDILQLWINKDFAVNSSIIVQLLSIGVLLNSLAIIPFTAIQALNRPDISAKIHIVELPLYLLVLTAFAYKFSIMGVALAWSLRIAVDTFILFYFYDKLTFLKRSNSVLSLFILITVSCYAMSLLIYNQTSFFSKVVIYIVIMCLFFPLFWFKAMSGGERQLTQATLQNFYNRFKRL